MIVKDAALKFLLSFEILKTIWTIFCCQVESSFTKFIEAPNPPE
jgi:hypothetical protein